MKIISSFMRNCVNRKNIKYIFEERHGIIMSELAPSILSADFTHLGEQLQLIEHSGAKVLHIDVMDGMFVPSISFGMPVIRSIRKECGLFFDVHLMVQEPVRYIKEFVDAGADSITIHVEACEDVQATIDAMAQYPVKKALSINPATSIDILEPYLDQIDMILVMGVEPGFGGQKLIPETLEKVKGLDQIRKERGYSFKIEFDGGVNRENLKEIIKNGTDIAVAGTAVFRGKIEENVRDLQEVIAGAS